MSLALRSCLLSLAFLTAACSGSVPIGAIPDGGAADAGFVEPTADASGPFDGGPQLPLSPVASLTDEVRFGSPLPASDERVEGFHLARTGEVTLVVWVERTGIKTLRVDSRGRALDATPMLIPHDDPRLSTMAVAGGDGRFLIAWVEPLGSTQAFRMAFIDAADGRLAWGPQELARDTSLSGHSLSITSAGSDFLIADVSDNRRRVVITRVQPTDRYRHHTVLARRVFLSEEDVHISGRTAIASDGTTGVVGWVEFDPVEGYRTFTRVFEVSSIHSPRSLLSAEPALVTPGGLAHIARGAAGFSVFVKQSSLLGQSLAVRHLSAPEALVVLEEPSPSADLLVRSSGAHGDIIVFDERSPESARHLRVSLDGSGRVEERAFLPAGVSRVDDVLPFDSHLLFAGGAPPILGVFELGSGEASTTPLATTTVAQERPRTFRVGNNVFITWLENSDPPIHRGNFVAPDGRRLFEEAFVVAPSAQVGIATDGHAVLAAWPESVSEDAQLLHTRIISPEGGPGLVTISAPLAAPGRPILLAPLVAWDGEMYQVLLPARTENYEHHHHLRRSADGAVLDEVTSMEVRARQVAQLTSDAPWLLWHDMGYARPIGEGRWEYDFTIYGDPLDGERGPTALMRWRGLSGDAPAGLSADGGSDTALLAWPYEGDDGLRDLRFSLLQTVSGIPTPAGETISIERPGSVSRVNVGAGPRSYLVGLSVYRTWGREDGHPTDIEALRVDTNGEIIATPSDDGIGLVQEGATDPSVSAFGPGRFLIAYTRDLPGLGTEVRARIADYPLDPFFVE